MKNKYLTAIKKKEYYEKNKEAVAEYKREYQIKNREILSAKSRIYYLQNKSTFNANSREYAKSHPDIIKRGAKTYRDKNKEKISISSREYKQKNRDSISVKSRAYRQKNKLRISQYDTEYARRKRASDIHFKLRDNLRRRLHNALKSNTKTGSAVRDLGCTIHELKFYLEGKFTDGMSWKNYGNKPGIKTWQIDHIVPLALFNLTNREQLLSACHYTNLQPLWAVDNIRKGAKLLV